MEMLKIFKKNNQNKYPGLMNMFGFGNSMDSELLNEMANETGGSYSFIYGTIKINKRWFNDRYSIINFLLGTVLINSLSNTLTTFSNNIKLEINLKSIKIKNFDLLYHYNYERDNDFLYINLGPLSLNQSRNILLPIDYFNESKIEMKLIYETPFNQNMEYIDNYQVNESNNDDILIEHCRIKFIIDTYKAIKIYEKDPKKSINLIENIISYLTTSKVSQNKFIIDLIKGIK
jgi:hypothetical protein